MATTAEHGPCGEWVMSVYNDDQVGFYVDFLRHVVNCLASPPDMRAEAIVDLSTLEEVSE